VVAHGLLANFERVPAAGCRLFPLKYLLEHGTQRQPSHGMPIRQVTSDQ